MICKGKNEGRIELILGPIFSGKSAQLIEVIRKHSCSAKKTVIVKFYAEKDSEKSEIITHDLIKYDSINCKKLRDSFNIIKTYDVIRMDEGQSFSHLVEVSEELALLKKIVVIAALNGDYKMAPFPVITRIISRADKLKLLKAYCYNCYRDAKFSLYYGQKVNQKKMKVNISLYVGNSINCFQ